MVSVKHLLMSKRKGFWTVRPDATAYEALQIMAENDVGALMVIQGEEFLGIFTERDYSRKVILKGKSSKETPVSDLMTRNVFTVTPEDTIEHCMWVMNTKHVRHLPVLEAGNPVGIVSIRDVVTIIISERERTIKDLEQYISS